MIGIDLSRLAGRSGRFLFVNTWKEVGVLKNGTNVHSLAFTADGIPGAFFH